MDSFANTSRRKHRLVFARSVSSEAIQIPPRDSWIASPAARKDGQSRQVTIYGGSYKLDRTDSLDRC